MNLKKRSELGVVLDRDADHVWHPFTQVQTDPVPLNIESAKGTLLFGEGGETYIDGISSWWVAAHGHSHPYIVKKLQEQLPVLNQVIFAGLTHRPAVDLAERLGALLPGALQKVFFSDNGSTSVEVALKMALQYWHNAGEKRTKIVALEGDYHGDTFGAMSVGGRNVFNQAYESQLFDCAFIPVPTVANAEASYEALSEILESGEVAAFIFEPVLQGASGMRLHCPRALNRLVELCKNRDVITIADEVLTGFGRTGKMFAIDHLTSTPDVICLSKALTAGVVPLGVTVTTNAIFERFLSDERRKLFWHGHSFTGNAFACTAALASLDLMEEPRYLENMNRIASKHIAFARKLNEHPAAKEVRTIGPLLAFDVVGGEASSYTHSLRDTLYRYFLSEGVLLRPLGNVVYTLPPACVTDEQLERIYEVMLGALERVHALSL